MLRTYFQLEKYRTTFRTEMIAGITTFLTMAYIIVVNPIILGDAGMDRGAVFVATALIAALGSLLMGCYANYPIALAPTMGMNAYFSYAVVHGMGHSWQVALSAVFFSGVLFLLLSLFKLRQSIVAAIPESLKIAISIGIGLFLGLIALKNIDVVTAMPNSLPHIKMIRGNVSAGLCMLGFGFIIVLHYLRVTGSILIGVLATTLLGIALGKAHYLGLVAWPPSMSSTFFALNFKPTMHLSFLIITMTFFFVGFFDATGTLIGVLRRCNFSDKTTEDPRFKKALIADSIATMGGSLCGTSTVGCYIESAAGVCAGGRTGLTAVVIGSLFLLSLFFSPLANSIPNFAAATALLYIACLMVGSVKEIHWRNISESLPCLITLLATPITFSIAEGISLGYVSFVLLKLLTGQFRQITKTMTVLTIIFLLYLVSVYLPT